MPTYVVLGNFTQEGIKEIKNDPERLNAAKQVVESVGGEIKGFYYTMGQYDFVAVAECPDLKASETIKATMQALFTIGSAGAVKTETLVALPIEEAAEVFEKLP